MPMYTAASPGNLLPKFSRPADGGTIARRASLLHIRTGEAETDAPFDLPVACAEPTNAVAPTRTTRSAKPNLAFIVLPCGRERLDHTKRLEPGELGDQRHLAARRRFEREKADLVLGDVDRSPEGDARPLTHHFLGGRPRPTLARLALTCSAACEERFYEVIRHASDAMARRSA